MEQRLIDMIHAARRWTDGHNDYLPTLGCSKCGVGCVPLCGLGLNRTMTQMEMKDVTLKSRKTMMETGKKIHPTVLQFVSSTETVIACEKALDCIEQRNIPGQGLQWVFVKPIPTLSGLICKECKACVLCNAPAYNEVRHSGRRITVCDMCIETCSTCQQPKVRHHTCCVGLGGTYFP
jgi:hypothetical protein